MCHDDWPHPLIYRNQKHKTPYNLRKDIIILCLILVFIAGALVSSFFRLRF